ncbi:MAG: Ig-like domain-containing protein, partial [Acidimicrobiales bacterium]|nr:Ig-like domain-containing protein [Acidimicrobiales bacterium]
MRKGEGHGTTAGGEAVKEFDGWTFIDPVSWNATAGQERNQFTKGQGVIAVADSDEYDDKADAAFDASLETPSIDISGAVAKTLILKYDSSWRKEPQHGAVTVSFDGGEEVTLLVLTPDRATAYNETVELKLNNPAGAKSAVVKWDHQGYNNWWWAIDNVSIYEGEVINSAPVVSDRSVEVKEGGTVSIILTGIDEDGDTLNFTVLSQPKNGILSGTAPDLSY